MRGGAFEHVDAGVGSDHRRQAVGEGPSCLTSARVHDAARRMAPLESEREAALGVLVEADTVLDQPLDGSGRGLHERRYGVEATKPATRSQGVGSVALGSVPGLECRGEATLRPVARALVKRLPGDEHGARARLGNPDRGVETGSARADDDHGHFGGGRGQARSTVTVPIEE